MRFLAHKPCYGEYPIVKGMAEGQNIQSNRVSKGAIILKLNENFQNIKESYLFSTIGQKLAAYIKEHPKNKIIKMGIGDVTRPLAPVVVDAMHKAVDEMGDISSFRGYPAAYGEDFLIQAIKRKYSSGGVYLEKEEIFVGDGAKSDVGNIVDLFDKDNLVMIPDPVYPAYVDTNLMAGRDIVYIDGTVENNFLPLPRPGERADIIYLCSPNNPTGGVYSREQLKIWVDFALENKAIILFDAAYEAFITDKKLPKSIFEIEGARRCAIEFCSLSKTAGFTGIRCGYTVIPSELEFDGVHVNSLWARRQATKFNGVSYITQRGAEAVFSAEGGVQVEETLDYYHENAEIMAEAFKQMGAWFVGGGNSPYIWFKCPNNMSSWEFFDDLLERAEVVGTPGSGFGKNGEGYFRLTAFGDREMTREAMERIKKNYIFQN